MQNLIEYLSQNLTALYIVVGVFSLCIGSFLNVVIYRTPKILEQEWHQDCQLLLHPDQPIIDTQKLTLSHPHSSCPYCKTAIRWYQNIPLISWIILKGKCANCKEPISIRYPLIEILTTLCALTVVYVLGPSIQMLGGLVLTYMLIALAFIDLDTQLLPDRFTLPLAAIGLGLNSFALYTSASSAIWGYILGFLCLWTVYYLYKILRNKEGMGYGDFKLIAALGAWLGVFYLPLIILLSSLLGAMIGVILLKIRKENLPFAFGPYIAIAGWITFLWGEAIMNFYFMP